MDNDIEKLSALYDGELNKTETQDGFEQLSNDDSLKKIFSNFGLISQVVQRNTNKNTSKIKFLGKKFQKLNSLTSNILTAAATVLITLIFIYQLDNDRFQVYEDSSLQLSSAISSNEAKNQLLSADQNIMEHMINIMQSNNSNSSQKVSKNWIPVGFSPHPNNPNQFSNGRNNLFFHLEKKQLGIKKVKYFKANNNWIYLIPLNDGRLLTAYGDTPPSVANTMIQEIYKRN